MYNLDVNFNSNTGKVKPLHAVNNGPVYKFTVDQRITNIDAFKEAGIPYARNHDASFYATYGGEHTVDIIAIFPDFSKDVNDPASYDFVLTDEYIKATEYAGTRTFYRLGSKIEHWPVKYGTVKPADFNKWAEICEHIIRHYTESWADGFKYDLEYWEIWNEPDIPDDIPYVDRKCWSGTKKEFFELFETTAKHLKKCFPHLKIGGPAVIACDNEWSMEFLDYCKKNDVPLDFFSWHRYTNTPQDIEEKMFIARKILDERGFTKTESILDEWNYVKGWTSDEWIYSLRTEKNLKGASLIAGVMSKAMYAPVDILMYYDARPCAMNGMFSTDFVCDKLKGYYPFWMFNKLYQLDNGVECISDDDKICGCAAKGNGKAAVMLTYYDDVDEAEKVTVKLNLKNLKLISDNKPVVAKIYLLDKDNDAQIVREETLVGTDVSLYLNCDIFTTCLVTFETL